MIRSNTRLRRREQESPSWFLPRKNREEPAFSEALSEDGSLSKVVAYHPADPKKEMKVGRKSLQSDQTEANLACPRTKGHVEVQGKVLPRVEETKRNDVSKPSVQHTLENVVRPRTEVKAIDARNVSESREHEEMPNEGGLRESPSVTHRFAAGHDEHLEQRPLSWEYVAAFFDGEGSVTIMSRTDSVDIFLAITQVDRKVLEDIARFLMTEGVSGTKVYIKQRTERHDIHLLDVLTNEGIERSLIKMIPFLRVKRKQALASLDYLEDKSTGNEYLEIMNDETRTGRRAGKVHLGDFPFTRSEGIRLARISSMARARSVYHQMLNSPDVKKHARLNAVERNIRRGIEKRKEILSLLADKEKSSAEIGASINKSRHHTNRLLRQLQNACYLTRERADVVGPFLYRLTQEGRRYLEGNGT
jgi:hypothetical protein